MRKNYLGLDILRGFGIFVLVMMHTAFYHFSGLYDLDLDNPPITVTIIGLMLMFAGLFAMISGLVHTLQYERKITEYKLSTQVILVYIIKSFGWMMLIAYLYFNITGPGIVNMAQRSMDESILVHLINTGKWIMPSLDRFLYIDSLVMIAMNILLVGLLYLILNRWLKSKKKSWLVLILAIVFFMLSLVRIPLYNLYLEGRDTMNWSLILPLNWLVNKNNPILPYFSFALMGMWLAYLLIEKDRYFNRKLGFFGAVLLIIGVVFYITLPDTMLQRAIDPVWFAIMMAQLGLFALMIGVMIHWFDVKKRSLKPISRFFSRYSKGGLSVFFIESVVSALIMMVLRQFGLEIKLDILGALAFGLTLSLIWGFVLILWEKKHYKYGIEYFMSKSLNHTATSEKLKKLKG
ncbi:MAG: hypothetical protein FD179_58 [Erysipelotrichaceae bacterium]|nr:MAG: hypothetical protein FD179_58 [Erysipelotrichaceae bacterium]